MCVWSLSGPLFHGGPGGGRTLCVLSFVLLDNRPLTPAMNGLVFSERRLLSYFSVGGGGKGERAVEGSSITIII